MVPLRPGRGELRQLRRGLDGAHRQPQGRQTGGAARRLRQRRVEERPHRLADRGPCSSAHNAEYIGFFRAPRTMPYPESDRQWFALYRQCSELATGYVGVTMSQWYRLSTIAWPAYPEAWAAGDRRVRCVVYFGTKKVKKTVKGTKGKGLPGF
ncbi:septum formation family protein [Catellatospora coxensis]